MGSGSTEPEVWIGVPRHVEAVWILEDLVDPIDRAVQLLRNYARLTFSQKIDGDPTRFLIPAMAKNGVTLESMAELYRQAGHVGAVAPDRQTSAAALFEQFRDRLYSVRDPWFRKRSAVGDATAVLVEYQKAYAVWPSQWATSLPSVVPPKTRTGGRAGIS